MAAEDPLYLDSEPPVWAARAFAWLLLALAAIGALALFTVQVPETIIAPFVIIAEEGADPVRTLHDGIVTELLVSDAQHVEAGAPLFVIGSEEVGDRSAERDSLGASLSGGQARLANERDRFDNQRRADEQELTRFEQRSGTLRTQLMLKERQWVLAKEVLARQRKSQDEGLMSWMEVSKQALDVDRLEAELEQVRADVAEIASSQARLRFEMASRRAAFDEIARGVDEELKRTRARKGMLDREDSRQGNLMTVNARCSGTVVRLLVRRTGLVVSASDTLAELACDAEALQAEVMVPERGVARVAARQPIKLQYDAFPYQRYGVRYATVQWISPASSEAQRGEGRTVRLLASLDEQVFRIAGTDRPVLPGMSGTAAIIVGRRSLASYAFEPLRQMREAMSAERPPVAATP